MSTSITYKVVEYANGAKTWYLNGMFHREDGPALEQSNGTKVWCLYGKLHREDGPAIEHFNGTKEWWLNDKLHRENGPAVEHSNGSKEWWLNGEHMSEEEHRARTQNPTCNGKIVEIDGKKYKLMEVE
jgi:hypothetical protein